MRTLHAKRFFALLGAAAALAVGLFVAHRLQSGRIAQALLWQARRAEDEGRLDQSVKFRGRYLQFVPDDVGERAHLARALAGDKLAVSPRAREQALFVCDQVLLRDDSRHDVRRLSAKLAMDLRRLDRAREHLDALAKAAPEDGEVTLLFGRWHEASDQVAEAAAAYRKAIQQAPQQLDAYVRLAALLRKQAGPATPDERRKEADAVMSQAVTANPQAFRAYLARWRYRADGPPLTGLPLAAAAKDVEEARKLAPDDADVLLAAAEAAQAAARFDDGREHLERAAKLHPEDRRVYQAQARLEALEGKPESRDRAVRCLNRGLAAVPASAQGDLLWTKANLLLDDDKADHLVEAGKAVEQLRKAGTSPAGADYLSARALARKNQWSEAARLFERARPQLAGAPELLLKIDGFLAQCYEQLDDPGQQRAACLRAAEQNPNSAAARIRLGAALAAEGRADEALAQYRQAMTLPDAPQAGWTEIARLTLARALRQRAPDWKPVEDALAQAEAKQRPAPAELVLLRAEALAAQKQFDDARRLLTGARDAQPKERRAEFWAALAALAELEGKPADALRLLDEAEKQLGDGADLRLARAGHWLRNRPKEAAAPLAALADKADGFSPADQSRLLRGLSAALFQAGQFAEAKRLWERLAAMSMHADDLRVQSVLFDLALQADDEPLAGRALEAMRRLEAGAGPTSGYGSAVLLIQRAKQGKPELLDEARARLDRVAAQRRSWPAVPLALAEIEALRENPEQAIAHYREAIQLGERSPRAVRQLVQLLYQRQRYAEADQVIRDFQKQQALSGDLRKLAADVSLRNQDPERAMKLAREAVTADSRDHRDCLWLGQTLAAAEGQSAEAEKLLRRAVELNDQVPETWVALVQFLAGRRRVADAETVIGQAKAKLPAAQAPLALAPCYEAVGRLDEARKQHEAALAARGDDVLVRRGVASFYLRGGRPRDAVPHLRAILDGKVKASDGDKDWARRSLALALATSFDLRQFAEALALVGLRLDAEGKPVEADRPSAKVSSEELRTRARVLATQRRRPTRVRAIAIFEDLDRRQALAPEDRYQLAQLYEADGNRPRAREQMRMLATAHGQEPLYLAHYARGLLRDRQFDEAQRWLERLEQLEKDRKAEAGSFGTVELRAQLLEARGQVEKALDLLRAFASRQGAHPDDLLLLVSYLTKHKKADEALERCAEAWKRCRPEDAGGASVSALRAAGKPTAAQCSRVEGWLRDALGSQKRPALPLHLQLAEVLDLQERHADAEAVYRQVLGAEPNNVVALNNLAWMLAHRPRGGGEAMPLIDRAIATVGPRAELLDTRAAVHLALGQARPALADLREAVQDAPNPARQFRIARAHQMTNNPEAAAEALRQAKAAGLEPEHLHPAERAAYRQLCALLKL